MTKATTTPDTTEQRYRKLGGFLLLLVIGCLAYVVLYPVGAIGGIIMGIMPPMPLVMIVLMALMEFIVLALAFTILRRDRRYIYVYYAGIVDCLAACITQGIIGMVTPLMVVLAVVVTLVGSGLMIFYFLRSQRVSVYFAA
ncbi:MAG: hypothetical protein FWF91_08005 [Coriobacteriia bacterium]|nr:hypothetical protein [Coriobacteriia bacterium]